MHILVLQAGVEHGLVAQQGPDAVGVHVLLQGAVGGGGLGAVGIGEAVGDDHVVLALPVVQLVDVADDVRHHVAVQQDVGAALVRVEAVDHAAAVSLLGGAAAVDVVVVHDGHVRPVLVALLAQGVDAAGILEDGADLLHPVAADGVGTGGDGGLAGELGRGGAVVFAPAPADAHAAVGALVDEVVEHLHVVGVEGGDGRIAGEEIAVLQQVVVGDPDVLRHGFRPRGEFFLGTVRAVSDAVRRRVVLIDVLRMSDDDARAAGPGNEIARHVAVPDVVLQVDAQVARVGYLAVQDADVLRRVHLDRRRGNVVGAVEIVVPLAGILGQDRAALLGAVAVGAGDLHQIPIGIGELDAVEDDVLRVALHGRAAPDVDELIQLGDDDLRTAHVLPCPGNIVQGAVRLVKVEFTGFRQPLVHVGHVVAAGGLIGAVPQQRLGDGPVGHLEIHLGLPVPDALQGGRADHGLDPGGAGFQLNVLGIPGVRGQIGAVEDVARALGAADPGPVRLSRGDSIGAGCALRLQGLSGEGGPLVVDVDGAELVVPHQGRLVGDQTAAEPVDLLRHGPGGVQPPAAGDDGLRPRRRLIANIKAVGAGVPLVKAQRLRQLPHAVQEINDDVARHIGVDPADLVPGPLQGRKGRLRAPAVA